ncbi:hypothetical protein [Burkholderia cenocepacia]|nr:hypothetical protein [Burkholderia cenocepacia]
MHFDAGQRAARPIASPRDPHDARYPAAIEEKDKICGSVMW